MNLVVHGAPPKKDRVSFTVGPITEELTNSFIRTGTVTGKQVPKRRDPVFLRGA
jgi:hypothetical protein